MPDTEAREIRRSGRGVPALEASLKLSGACNACGQEEGQVAWAAFRAV